jgi:hypothetical protein
MDDVNGLWIYLGALDLAEVWAGGTLGFSMGSVAAATPDWAQGDSMAFTVEFHAQQVEGTPLPGTELAPYLRV